MSQLDVVARFKIHPGKMEVFKTWAYKCMENVRMHGEGMSKYDWYFDESNSTCVVLETYDSSEAVLKHAADLGEMMGEGHSYGDFTGEVFGKPSTMLLEVLSSLEVTYFDRFQMMQQ